MKKQLLYSWLLAMLFCITGASNAWGDTYVKVTSISDLEADGQYLIVNTAGTYAAGATSTTSTKYATTVSVSVSNNEITNPNSNVAVYTLGGNSTDGWTFYSSKDSKYLYWTTGNSLNVNATVSDNSKWSISLSNGTATIANKATTSRIIRFNSDRFACYTTNTGTLVSLYKKQAAVKTDPTITFNDGSVRVGQNLDLSTLFTSNSEGAVTYSITEGGSYASLAGTTLTGTAVGSVTVKAAQAAAGNYNAGEATATITVNAALTLSSIAITTAPSTTTYTEGETFDPTGMVVTATYSDNSTYDVTASCTYSPSTSTALTTSDTEITVSYTENAVEKTTTQAITVNALPKYTVTFADDSSTETQASYGASVTLPSRSNTAGYTFAGWSTTNVPTETTTAPTIIPAGSYTPTANITLYPVYSKTEGGATPTAFSVGNTGSYAIVAYLSDFEKYYALPTNPTVNNGKITAQEITVSELNDVKYVTPTNASGFTWTIATATNGYTLSDGSHYIYHSNGGASGTNLTYGDVTSYTWSFTADGNYIKMAGMSGSTTNNRGLLFSDTTIGGYSLSNWNTYDKTMILPIANAGTTYYWSAPVAAAVEKPTITVESPFTISTEVTMSCETDGATIYYTLDGTDPTAESTEYTAPFNINATTTIKAIAIKGSDESAITTVTATKRSEAVIVIADDNIAYGSTFTVDDSVIEGGDITVSSSNEAVATVEGLVITPHAVGSTTITVSTAQNDTYQAGSETFTLTVTAPTGLTTAAPAPATVFNETFAECTGTAGWSGTGVADGDLHFDNTGWNSYKGSGNGGSAKFGASNAQGYAITPAFGQAGDFTISFKSASWSGDKTTDGLVLSIEEGEGTLSTSTFSLVDSEWKEYSTTITGATVDTRIKFSAAQTSKNRFFLDDVVVMSGTSITATLNASGYASFCSEYPLDFSKAEGYTAWQVTSVNSSTGVITFSKVTGSVKGGTGLLLKGTPNATVELTSVNSSNTLDDNLLYGTLAPTYVVGNVSDGYEYYGLSGETFKKINTGTVKAGKAILPASNVSSARLTFIFEDGETTGIESLTPALSNSEGAQAVYDLQGRKVQNPKRGLYIINGKKVVIK